MKESVSSRWPWRSPPRFDGIRLGEDPPEPLDEGLMILRRRGTAATRHTSPAGNFWRCSSSPADDLVVQQALGDVIVDQLLNVKRAEWEDYRRYVSPWELAHYGDA
ncbi:MAG: hypothetical protein R2843_09055 [Thermomicrobiales bacterium]